MKISANINFARINTNNESKKTNKLLQIDTKNIALSSYPSNYYLNFKGGKSLDLDCTYQQIDKLSYFPPNIKQAVSKTLQSGNANNATLVDVHKSVYQDLLACADMEEIKFFFPEFSDVLLDNQVIYKKGSFIDKFKAGEFKTPNGNYILNPALDLSYQLIQMYYADCLSVADLRDLLGVSPLSVMKKLNIPLFDNTYGYYLKLSDAQKNQVISSAISRNNQIRPKANSTSRKHVEVSLKIRKKISESLKKYYSENPNIVFDRKKQQICNDSFKSAIFSEVIRRAWSYKEAKPILETMSKYMKNSHIDPETCSIMMTTNIPQNEKLQAFWDNNPKAKDRFSSCVEKSWMRQKELEKYGLISEPTYLVRILPKTMFNGIIEMEPEIGEDIFYSQFVAGFNSERIDLYDDKTKQEIQTRFDNISNDKGFMNYLNIVLHHACINYYNSIVKGLPKNAAYDLSEALVSGITQKASGIDLVKKILSVESIPSSYKNKLTAFIDNAGEILDDTENDEFNIAILTSQIEKVLNRNLTTFYFDKQISSIQNGISKIANPEKEKYVALKVVV